MMLGIRVWLFVCSHFWLCRDSSPFFVTLVHYVLCIGVSCWTIFATLLAVMVKVGLLGSELWKTQIGSTCHEFLNLAEGQIVSSHQNQLVYENYELKFSLVWS